MSSIFSKIISGEIPAYKIAETDRFLAFLDIFPLQKGHVLVIPKVEVDYLFDLDPETYNELWDFTRSISLAVKRAIPCERVGVAVLGMEVPHAHIHLVPINHEGDLNFSNPKLKISEAEFIKIAASIATQV